MNNVVDFITANFHSQQKNCLVEHLSVDLIYDKYYNVQDQSAWLFFFATILFRETMPKN